MEEIAKKLSDKNYAASFKMIDKLIIYFGEHTIFEGFYLSYINDCPIILSPDIFWALIIQGFKRHVLTNSEELRKKFVDFNGKKQLNVDNMKYPNLEDIPKEEWENNFKTYISKISYYIGKDLINTLKPDFSTTTKIISQVGQINVCHVCKYFLNIYYFIVDVVILKLHLKVN